MKSSFPSSSCSHVHGLVCSREKIFRNINSDPGGKLVGGGKQITGGIPLNNSLTDSSYKSVSVDRTCVRPVLYRLAELACVHFATRNLATRELKDILWRLRECSVEGVLKKTLGPVCENDRQLVLPLTVSTGSSQEEPLPRVQRNSITYYKNIDQDNTTKGIEHTRHIAHSYWVDWQLVEEVSRVSAKEFSRVKARVFVEQELSE